MPNQYKGDKEILQDMRNTACMALLFAEGRIQNDFSEDLQLLLAVVKSMEIIGEAAKRISNRRRKDGIPEHEGLPAAEWRKMIRMRDWLAHVPSIGSIDTFIIWQTVQKDLPR